MNTRRVIELSIFLALSVVLGYVESFLPSVLPGVKPGFANIIIEGTLISPTGISTPVTFTLPVTTEYYNLAGQRVSSNTKGIVIEKQRMQDGTIKAVKKIRR